MSHKFYNDWDEFWQFYITSVKNDIGPNKFKSLNSSQVSKKLPMISKEEILNIINPIIREHGYISDSITLVYDPNATTFYSQYKTTRKPGTRIIIGYPTFTRYMIYWKPAVEAAFRHELGHILRRDIFLQLSPAQNKNANVCMDIRINANISREAMGQVYKCLYFKDQDVPLLVPEQQFPKIGLPYNHSMPIVPSWEKICHYYNLANKREKENEPDDDNENETDNENQTKYQVGDFVIIDDESSEHNDKYGRVEDIIDGEYVIIKVSQEMAEAVLEQGNVMKLTTDDEFLGIFQEGNLLPLIPQEDEGGGDYGDDEDESEPGGEAGEDENETIEDDGTGDEGDEPDDDDSIKEKEDILDELQNGGVDGESSEKPTFADDGSDDEDWNEKVKDHEESEENNEDEGSETEEGNEEGSGKIDEEDNGEEIENEDENESQSGGKTEKTEREEELDKEIAELALNKRIKQSIDAFSKVKDKHGDKLTQSEIGQIQSSIDELEKLL